MFFYVFRALRYGTLKRIFLHTVDIPFLCEI